MTATAEVIQLPDTGAFKHPWTELVLEAREAGCHSRAEIAEWIAPHIDWANLPWQSKVALLTKAVDRGYHHSRADRVRSFTVESESVGGVTEAPMRMTVSPSVWDVEWDEVGGKQTRDLTAEDVDTLKMAYKIRTARNLLRARWFESVQKLMAKHKVSRLGELEEKGVALPTEAKVEAGK